MKKQVNVKERERKPKTKDLHVRLPIDTYNLFEERARERKLDKKSYVEYLIRKDRDDLQCPRAAEAINQISAATVRIMESYHNGCGQCGKECPIRPFVIDIEGGVENLWQYL